MASDENMVLGEDETLVYTFLKHWPGELISESEIARRAGHKAKFRENPGWAIMALSSLVEMGLVEHGTRGRFRVPNRSTKKCRRRKRFVSPEIMNLLGKKGYCDNCLENDCNSAETSTAQITSP